jgi:hypothetical protein
MKIEDITVENLREASKLYEKRFGECPVDIFDGGGEEGLLELLKTALLTGEPIEDPYEDDPDILT